jgi:hypothetical protein
MWVIEAWHGLFLVLVVAFGMAALAALSCVAMAGIDAADDEDAPVRNADRTARAARALPR